MRKRNAFITGMAVILSFYGCAELVDVEEHAPEAGSCIDCHSNAALLEKLAIEEEGSAAGGG